MAGRTKKLTYLLGFISITLFISACAPTDSIKVPQIGDAVPNISWTTINGEKIDLNQFKGSWVLLCYWCSCDTHRNDILTIQNVYDALYEKNLKVIVIDDSDIDWISLKDFAEGNNLPFYLVEDNQKSISIIKTQQAGRAEIRPNYFLIDTNGNLHDIRLATFRGMELPINNISQDDIVNLDSQDYTAINVITFLQDVIRVKIDNVSINNITPNGATIRWQTSKSARCMIGSDKCPLCPLESEPSVYHELPLWSCPPNEIITFTIVAYGGLDLGKIVNGPQISDYIDIDTHSDEFSFTTLTAPHISNAKISKITDTSAELYWETDQKATSIATIFTKGDSDQIWWTKIISEIRDINFTKIHTYTIDNLVPGTFYSVDLKSEDLTARYNTYSYIFSTQPSNYANKAKILNFNISDITEKSAVITWSTDRPVSCWSNAPELCISGDEPTTDHSQILSHLEPETEYSVQVGARSGGVSDVFNFKTLKATDTEER